MMSNEDWEAVAADQAMTIVMLKSTLEETLEFLLHCWRDVEMNQFSFDYLNETIDSVERQLNLK